MLHAIHRISITVILFTFFPASYQREPVPSILTFKSFLHGFISVIFAPCERFVLAFEKIKLRSNC